jgi:hypothetical protein
VQREGAEQGRGKAGKREMGKGHEGASAHDCALVEQDLCSKVLHLERRMYYSCSMIYMTRDRSITLHSLSYMTSAARQVPGRKKIRIGPGWAQGLNPPP